MGARKATWRAVMSSIVAAAIAGCGSSSSCGSILSESVGPHACWLYPADHRGAVVGGTTAACPTANQLGACDITDHGPGACGVIYYGDDGFTVDEARRSCRAQGGAWSP